MWDTSPPRQVTAGDFVREFKTLCNPVSPVGASGYFTTTIVGDAGVLRRVRARQAARRVNGHALAGDVARDPLTLDFTLTTCPGLPQHPCDGLQLHAPRRDAKYGTDSAQMRQHTISDGPYRVTSYVPTKSCTNRKRSAARNPATSEHVGRRRIVMRDDAEGERREPSHGFPRVHDKDVTDDSRRTSAPLQRHGKHTLVRVATSTAYVE